MTTVQSSRTGIASRTAEPNLFRRITPGPGALTRLDDTAGITPNNAGPREVHELVALDEFLARHVQPDALRDVQCMLLWSEWVRMYQRQNRSFPRVVLEKEFREAVLSRHSVDIMIDEVRGAVYPGLRFIP